ncbi:MAG: phosphoribosylamine--glycine ligase [bacterium]|nr:phosphoribosylamine--glycine ligase [bacterium]
MRERGLRVLVVGGGGREHALVTALAASPRVADVWCAPGNPGIAEVATPVPVAADDLPGLVEHARALAVDVVVVGPEAPLVAGLVDALSKAGISAFGPTAAGARLEASKAWSKALMREAGLPTADFEVVSTVEEADQAIDRLTGPRGVVVKADGLAAGKGVVVAGSVDEARETAREWLAGGLGEAGRTLVIEQRLSGQEASLIAVVDGTGFRAFPLARDHKALCDGDEGPNTGGMGVVSPVTSPDGDPQVLAERLFPALLAALRARGIVYRGVVFAGLMFTDAGPSLLEFNCRFGDPEAQVLLAGLDMDLVDLLEQALETRLDGSPVPVRPGTRVCVVAAAPGYPGTPARGQAVAGLETLAPLDGVHVFHAGTRLSAEGVLETAGGRVLNVVGSGDSVEAARARAYEALAGVTFAGVAPVYRRDIGLAGAGRR